MIGKKILHYLEGRWRMILCIGNSGWSVLPGRARSYGSGIVNKIYTTVSEE